MKKTIWVVEQGCYSDYHVVGVFASQVNAQRVADAINAPREDKYTSDEATIAEWPFDPAVQELQQGLSLYLVQMLEDGTVERISRCQVTGYEIGGSVSIWRRTQAPAYQGKGIPDALQATVWAKDERHAIKITNEHRTRLIASGEWHSAAKVGR